MGIPDEQLVIVATRGELLIVERPLQPAHLTNQTNEKQPACGQSERAGEKRGPVRMREYKTRANQIRPRTSKTGPIKSGLVRTRSSRQNTKQGPIRTSQHEIKPTKIKNGVQSGRECKTKAAANQHERIKNEDQSDKTGANQSERDNTYNRGLSRREDAKRGPMRTRRYYKQGPTITKNNKGQSERGDTKQEPIRTIGYKKGPIRIRIQNRGQSERENLNSGRSQADTKQAPIRTKG